MFSACPTQLCYMKHHRKFFFNCKSNMAAAKPEVHLSRSTNELATKFQRLYTCFSRCPTQLYYVQCCFQLKIEDGDCKTRNTFISAYVLAINEILKGIPMFSRVPDSTVLCNITGSCSLLQIQYGGWRSPNRKHIHKNVHIQNYKYT